MKANNNNSNSNKKKPTNSSIFKAYDFASVEFKNELARSNSHIALALRCIQLLYWNFEILSESSS